MTRPRVVRIGRLRLDGVAPRDPARFRAVVEQAIAARLSGGSAVAAATGDAPLARRVADAVARKTGGA